MREERSRSQILFGFLPEQTVDLVGRVWKVKEWQDPIRKSFDEQSVRHALRTQAAPWAAQNTDGGYVNELAKGFGLEVVSLDMDSGVRVQPFPKVWVCRQCRRVASSSEKACRCGSRSWGPFHFVGYHECGALRSPYIPRCKQHDDVEVVYPGTASAGEIKFLCPTCKRQLQKGLGMPMCECGNGRLQFTVHRASSVYTPRGVVVINPPSPEQVKELVSIGGGARALSWVLEGSDTDSFKDMTLTPEGFEQQLVAQGLSTELAKTLTKQAIASGELQPGTLSDGPVLADEVRDSAERDAITIAMALSDSRVRISHLVSRTTPDGHLGRLYREEYPESLNKARLGSLDLIDQLPILTGNFGYTRGDSAPGKSRLVPFRRSNGKYVVYADIAQTESFFVQLDPVAVLRWLNGLGHDLTDSSEARACRLAILERSEVPAPGQEFDHPSCGSDLLSLVHSYAHHFIRQTALFSGVERSSLAELLVPTHLGFFIYAAARGDFVLGGLQAVFEEDLHSLLNSVVESEHRCPLDPGCQKSGGACVACLHLGEPSCRYYNRYLDRGTLWGPKGYLTTIL